MLFIQYNSCTIFVQSLEIDFGLSRILMCIIIIICAMYFVYPLIKCLVFQKMILLYHLMQIVIGLMIYSIILYHYYNKAVQFCSIITYFMVFIIVEFCVVLHWWKFVFFLSWCIFHCSLIKLWSRSIIMQMIQSQWMVYCIHLDMRTQVYIV